MECTNWDRFKEPDEEIRGIYEPCCECGEDILVESDTHEIAECYEFENEKGGLDLVCEDCLKSYCERFKRKDY